MKVNNPIQYPCEVMQSLTAVNCGRPTPNLSPGCILLRLALVKRPASWIHIWSKSTIDCLQNFHRSGNAIRRVFSAQLPFQLERILSGYPRRNCVGHLYSASASRTLCQKQQISERRPAYFLTTLESAARCHRHRNISRSAGCSRYR